MYEHFGLAAILVLFGGALFIVWRWPLGKHATLSQHVSVSRPKILYYIFLFTIVLTLLLLFFWKWFMPTFHVSGWFGVCVAVAAIAQYACTLIPEVGGWKTVWHRFLAGLAGAALIPALAVLATASDAPTFSKYIILLSLATMVGIIALLLKNGRRHSHFLILQFCYFGAFFIPILLIAYT